MSSIPNTHLLARWANALFALCLLSAPHALSQEMAAVTPVAAAGSSNCLSDAAPTQITSYAPTAKIISLMTTTQQSNSPYLVISAHRGFWKNRPENSFTAFYIAAQMGADALEIDVSDTSDRVPVLMHDSDVSRTTTYQGSNGNIGSMTSASFQQLYLRDRHGCPVNDHTYTLSYVLGALIRTVQGYAPVLVNNNGTLGGPALVIDIKNRSGNAGLYQTLMDAITTYKKSYSSASGFRPAVAFKVPIRAMPQGTGGPAQFASDVAAYTGDADVPQMIYVKFPDDPLPGAAPTDSSNVAAADPTFTAYINDSHTLHVETNEKYLNDTMTPYRNYLSIEGRAIAGYSPENFFPEGQPHSGRCCGTENTYYSQGSASNQSSPQPGCFQAGSPTSCLDLTGRWDFLAATQMTVMTTERVDDAILFATFLGRRTLP